MVSQRAECHVIIRLLDEGVEGENIWGRKMFLRYEDIVKIYLPSWQKHVGFQMLEVLDRYGRTIIVASGLNNLGQCMEYIRDHSWNIEHVDFGKIDQSALHWNNPDSY
jgi:hypothetical protein